MSERFQRGISSYPRYTFGYDDSRREVFVEMTDGGWSSKSPQKIYFDGHLIEELKKYSEEAGVY